LPAAKEQLHSFFDHLEAALEARGYFRPAAKKPKMVDNLRAVLTRPGFAEAELKVLRGVLTSLDYFSPKQPRGAGYPDRKAKVDREAHHEEGPAPLSERGQAAMAKRGKAGG
jgi:tRNA/rRNA methyltransferase